MWTSTHRFTNYAVGLPCGVNMGTDWPGVPAFIRTPHFSNKCTCNKFFRPGMAPVPFYKWQGLPQTDTRFTWLEESRWLIPSTDTLLDCQWRYAKFDIPQDQLEELFIRLVIDQNFPETFNFVVHVFLDFGGQQYGWRTVIEDLPWRDSPPPARGTIWDTGWSAWLQFLGPPFPMTPVGSPTIFPAECIPGWEWGETIPDPAP